MQTTSLLSKHWSQINMWMTTGTPLWIKLKGNKEWKHIDSFELLMFKIDAECLLVCTHNQPPSDGWQDLCLTEETVALVPDGATVYAIKSDSISTHPKLIDLEMSASDEILAYYLSTQRVYLRKEIAQKELDRLLARKPEDFHGRWDLYEMALDEYEDDPAMYIDMYGCPPIQPAR